MYKTEQDVHNRIPIAVSLDAAFNKGNQGYFLEPDKKRLLYISLLAVCIAAITSMLAKLLVYLINLITNLSFHLNFSFAPSSPATNTYGAWIILVPAFGGLIVGLMALYGSKAIRGHGIPEAMEQILTNKSRIRPSVTYLKPLSAAVSIGTGGPFGAEGPIIATGGALGSTLGQVMRITPYERKILLAAGATAGMSAIFGSPIAAIFLAIELLLFEFSPRSIVPVALACITGAAGHHFLFDAGPVFPTPFIDAPGNSALAIYSIIGLVIGFLSAAVTKFVYWIEDAFEKLPVHWMWWPMIGGLAVGFVGYMAPRTLGVGYENITQLLSGHTAIGIVLSLCFLKFISWAIALGSGTSGGTLAPLLTIGGAAGALLGAGVQLVFPHAGVVMPLAVLVGMSAMFAGASRALLTSIVFAVETTGQTHALLPLLAACLASFLVSYLLMKNTIMTEKIARRGVATPHVYEPDILDNVTVDKVMREQAVIIGYHSVLSDIRAWLLKNRQKQQNFYVVADEKGVFQGIVSSSNLFSMHHDENMVINDLIKRKPLTVGVDYSLKQVVEIMARENLDVLAVRGSEDNKIIGVVSYRDVLAAYRTRLEEHKENKTIFLKERALRFFSKKRKRLSVLRQRMKY